MKSFVIHLARAAQRKPNVEELRASLPGALEVIDAVDARDMSSDDIAKLVSGPRHFPTYPFKLRTSEVACFLSHRKAWQLIADGNASGAMVLEDDVVLDVPVFSNAFALVEQHVGGDDFVRFPYKNRETPSRTLANTGETCLFEPKVCGLGMQAQYVGRSAARRLLDATKQFDRPVDTLLQQTWVTGQLNYTVWPSGVSEISGDIGGSTIGERKSIANNIFREVARPAYRLALWAAIQSKGR